MNQLTTYQTIYNLTELDIRNLQILAAHTGQNMTVALHDALYFCQLGLKTGREGNCMSVMYKRSGAPGTTNSINFGDVAKAYNSRPKNAQPVNVKVNRHTDALQAINDVKQAVNATSDSVAVAFALEYAATAVRRLQNCNGGKFARIFMSRDNNPYNGGSILRNHPYDITLANKFRRAGRKMKAAALKLNPFKKDPPPAPEEKQPVAATPAAPAPAAAPTPAPDPAAEPAPKPLDIEIEKMHDGVLKPVKTLKPVTFRKPGGFNL